MIKHGKYSAINYIKCVYTVFFAFISISLTSSQVSVAVEEPLQQTQPNMTSPRRHSDNQIQTNINKNTAVDDFYTHHTETGHKANMFVNEKMKNSGTKARKVLGIPTHQKRVNIHEIKTP